ncbi:UvrD-helicase domain-containing protein [Roseomonas sp. SSH11]|uniref:DNA 3'-5' helicase n=1 Tax=Pararoseomonas baculiformis TaxID=2820812 RepID=A0ABS4AL70_9PROT|nr:ATP-dependent helicase [Pararoseomonas baculiformis]MBP0447265.1 UvrD-helicase domain-containing protein [Pararoseomonas baculiformis]
MDSLEAARQAAAALHAEVVAKLPAGWGPYDLAVAAARHRDDTQVNKVAPGSAILHRGRARYRADIGVIAHEDTGDEFENALLVAHEVGHLELEGRTNSDPVSDVDSLASVERSPGGVEALTDYSRRERREVRMNLFARELLLPRPVARELHLDPGLTASAIAARYRVPFAVAAAQLLDGLLLPPAGPASPPRPERPLNPEQAEAAAHRGVPYLLEAGPGTGKTQTLVSRVASLARAGVDPAEILVLTFSNKAAAELRERIAGICPEASTGTWVGTFHSFGLDVIRRFNDRLGLPADPRLLDRVEAVELLEEGFARLDLKHFRNLWDPAENIKEILDAISRANDEVVDAARYAELATAMSERAATTEEVVAAERCLDIATVFRAYEVLKAKRGCLDFGDLVARPVRLLETDAEVRAALRDRHRHVLVDEFQDVNRASVRLLQGLTGEGENLWAVGDVRQSIYRFRGASSFNVARFGAGDFPTGVRGRLRVNYRSTPEVVAGFVRFAAAGMKAAPDGEVVFDAHRPACGIQPEYRPGGETDEEPFVVAAAVAEMHEAGFSYRDQAVLCMSNDKVAKVAAALEARGIPSLYLGNLFERPEVKSLLAMVSLLVDRRAAGLIRIAAMPDFEMTLSDVLAVTRPLRDDGTPPLGWTSRLMGFADLSADGLVTMNRIAAACGGAGPDTDPWTFLAGILFDHSRIAADIARSPTVTKRLQGIAIWQFMNFARVQPRAAGLPVKRFLDRVRKLLLLAEDRHLRQLPDAAQGMDAVRLMTIHGAKGLEFPVVHLPGLTADTIPKDFRAGRCLPPDGMIEGATGSGLQAMADGHAEEQECLFFVALSRPKDRLLLYSPTQKKGGVARNRSPFLDRMGDAVNARSDVPTVSMPEVTGDMLLPAGVTTPTSLTVGQLGLYERCPRRFMYTAILDIGGRQVEAAFQRMHAAVEQVVNWMTSDHELTPSAAEVDARLDQAWLTHGPHEHGYSTDYLRVGRALLSFFQRTRQGRIRLPAREMRFAVEGGEVVIRAEEIIGGGVGGGLVRRVRTGHGTKAESNSLVTAAFRLAAGQHLPGCSVELVHLADETLTPVTMTDKVLGNRKAKLDEAFASMKRGEFPRRVTDTCPRCPAYFICGPLPAEAT